MHATLRKWKIGSNPNRVTMITLEKDSSGFQCPYCKEKFRVTDWDTEYNDPVLGSTIIDCPECNKHFTIYVHIEIDSVPLFI